jgi:hypothetical protein
MKLRPETSFFQFILIFFVFSRNACIVVAIFLIFEINSERQKTRKKNAKQKIFFKLNKNSKNNIHVVRINLLRKNKIYEEIIILKHTIIS